MTTFLDTLANLLTDPAAARAYRQDPAGWLTAEGAGFLCGEDVVEAVPALAERLAGPAADRLRARSPVEPVAPRPDETELDAAVRQLDPLVEGPSGPPPEAAEAGRPGPGDG
ncbi:hypothetical protein BH24ACT3_BH24ACT3_07490 [soil metagenome]